MLRKTYNWIMEYASHPKAVWLLAGVSFAESSFFPLPPDPLYIAMIVSKREHAWRLAVICTIASVVGGVLGYYIGYGLYETLGSWIIQTYGLEEKFSSIQETYQDWAFWIIAGKGLTPIPYKLVTISSGVAKVSMATFLVASVIARGFRFFSVAALFYYSGPTLKEYIEENLGLVTTAGVVTLIGGFIIIKYLW